MSNTFRQFRDLSNPVDSFERLFGASLESFLPDLADAPWYVRERDVVNLFVFGHLIPRFQAEGLDIGQVGIEVPVQVLPQGKRAALGVYADIVVWPHKKATVWRTCKPLARIEWKNISCRERAIWNLKRQHQEDIEHLQHNWQQAWLNYAVLTTRQGGKVSLQYTRIANGKSEDLAPSSEFVGSGDESTVVGLEYRAAMSRAQACSECIQVDASGRL